MLNSNLSRYYNFTYYNNNHFFTQTLQQSYANNTLQSMRIVQVDNATIPYRGMLN